MNGKTIAGIGALSLTLIGYSIGLKNHQNELKKELEPLRQEMQYLIDQKIEENPKFARFDFDYDGKIKEISDVVKEFSADNGKDTTNYKTGWKTEVTPLDKYQVAETPTPLILNPKYWCKPIDVSSIKMYQNKHK
jgi:hypothetical protein